MKQLLLFTMILAMTGSLLAGDATGDIAVPDLQDSDLRGPIKSVDTKTSINVSGQFERERTEYNEAGNVVSETEWNPDGKMANTLTNSYDEDGVFSAQTYINYEKKYTNNWEVFLNPETRQIAMKKETTGAASVYTYNEDGYLINYRHVKKDKSLVSASVTKRDELNRKTEYTRMDEDGKPRYTYWFRWKDDGLIDRERQKYRQEKGERLHVYDYLKTDEFGNWTQRLMVRYDIGGKEKRKVYERLVVRDIEYYSDDAPENTPKNTPGKEGHTLLGLLEKTSNGEKLGDIINTNKLSGEISENDDPVAVSELLQTGRSQEELKECFDYTFDDVADKLVIISCKSERGRSAGSGFIAKMDGKTYLFTNQHVIMGADSIRLKTAEGESIMPAGTVELSNKRDIARIALNDRDAFEITSKFSMGSPLGVFGNSEGAGVATELFGEVTGLGVDLVEVNAEFVSGNSGSPILDINRNVIGIASYVRVTWEPPKKDKKKDTSDEEKKDSDEEEEDELESKTRRFCYRLDELKWQPVKWKEYNQKYGKLYRNTEGMAENVFDIIGVWSNSPLERIPEKDDMAHDLSVWVKKHNDIIERYKRRKYKKNSFLNAYSQSLEILSKTCHDRSKRVKMFANQRELSGFLKDEFEKNAYSLQYAGRYIQAIADDIAGQ